MFLILSVIVSDSEFGGGRGIGITTFFIYFTGGRIGVETFNNVNSWVYLIIWKKRALGFEDDLIMITYLNLGTSVNGWSPSESLPFIEIDCNCVGAWQHDLITIHLISSSIS
jgi:hypothetical protein